MQFVRLAITSMLFVGAVVILQRFMANRFVLLVSGYRSLEFAVLFTTVFLGGVTWCAHAAGLPAAVGAFAAGLILSENRRTAQIEALVLPFRETFAAVFFVSLGLLFDVESSPIGRWPCSPALSDCWRSRRQPACSPCG